MSTVPSFHDTFFLGTFNFSTNESLICGCWLEDEAVSRATVVVEVADAGEVEGAAIDCLVEVGLAIVVIRSRFDFVGFGESCVVYMVHETLYVVH